MAALKVPKIPDSSSIATSEGTDAILGFYNSIAEFMKRAKALLDGTILDERVLVVQYVENIDYPIALNLSWPITIQSVTSKSSTGTCTATVKINTTALGGTANSVSSSEQTQAHTTSNEAAAGDDVKVTASSNSSCEMMQIKVQFTRPLFS